MIEKFFEGDLKVQIVKYCNKLESISKEYDVLIFMARKSICFYDALVLNGEIERRDREIVVTTSSRILSYDCGFLKGKRIALLDDIVIKGNTLKETINFLYEKDICNFDIYYIASQKIEEDSLINRHLKETILVLHNTDILVLGNSITNYISASACSYNVDYPVFYMDLENDFFEKYIQMNNCAVIPGNNPERKTCMYVQNFDSNTFFSQYDVEELKGLGTRKEEIILKIRIFYRKEAKIRKVVVIPIIVLPGLYKEEITAIYEAFASPDLDEMVKNEEENKEICNMLRVVQYILSYQLFVSIFQGQYDFKYSISNQDYIFPNSYSGKIMAVLKKCPLVSVVNIKDTETGNDFLGLSETYRYFFDFIGEHHKKDEAHNMKFSFYDVLSHCMQLCNIEEAELKGYVSVLFDYAIDIGLVVPENSIQDGVYMRSYRLSEQYELHEKEFDLIIYMYNEYQKKTEKMELNKVLSEKLLVLFFRQVISKILDEYKSDNEENQNPKNLFGITYAKFGPVVSDSLDIGVSKDTYLTERLFDESRSPWKRLYENNGRKLYVKESTEKVFKDLPVSWKRKTKTFIKNYDYLERLLNFHEVFKETRYINSFDKLLTISAIGESKDNQLLSLAAELKLYQEKVGSVDKKDDVIDALDNIMDGIESGIWKYICYAEEEYQKCFEFVTSKIGKKQEEYKYLELRIEKCREKIDALEVLEKSCGEDYIQDVNNFLAFYQKYYVNGRKDNNYLRYVEIFNNVSSNAERCRYLLKQVIQHLRDVALKSTDKLTREKETIKEKYIDDDWLENVYEAQDVGKNRNEKLEKTVEKLMAESAMILYEIMAEWKYILENRKNLSIGAEIQYTERNVGYLSKIQMIFKDNDEFKKRQDEIQNARQGFDSVIKRLRELVFEIDLLMFCINKYIMENSSKFYLVQRFYVIRRDGGDRIELSEIMEKKKNEKALNKYLGFEKLECMAVISKGGQSDESIEKLCKLDGYTLINYDCKRICNMIVKQNGQCYSKRVKKNINKILESYSGKMIIVAD